MTWSAKDKNEGGGIIKGFIPDAPENQRKPQVQISAATPSVRDRISRFIPRRQSKGLKQFGPLFVDGEPTEDFKEICSAYMRPEKISQRLLQKVANASAHLDFHWLEGYAEVVRLISEEIDDDSTAHKESWDKYDEFLPVLVELVKNVHWENLSEREKNKTLEYLPTITRAVTIDLINGAIALAGGDSSQICVEQFKATLNKSRKETAIFRILAAKFWDSVQSKELPPASSGVTNDELVDIIKALTEDLLEQGELRPPSKSEVKAEVNALLKKRGLSYLEWDYRRLNDSLASLGLLWLAHPREVRSEE